MLNPAAMAGVTVEEKSFVLESSVRGHHIYKKIWTPKLGQSLQVRVEPNNKHDTHAVKYVVVGHLPHEFSRPAFYFLKHGGRITCELTAKRRISDVLNIGDSLHVYLLREARDDRKGCRTSIA